jgi:imidazoleglycerol-phosphate dehydratase
MPRERSDEMGMNPRIATVTRTTKETDITVSINLDGTGSTDIETGVPFFDHMLDSFGRHGLFDLTVRTAGDIQIDAHHTVEDTGIVLGQAIDKALGDRRGIARYGSIALPMDETLILAAIDLSGRGQAHLDLNPPIELLGNFNTTLADEFFISFASNARMTLHLRQLAGKNSHHIIEAASKACARALKQAVSIDSRVADQLPTTKGSL